MKAEDVSERQMSQLLRASKSVLDAFMSGYHPTEQQLDRLAGAIAFCEAQKVCWHPIAEECDCYAEAPR